jgi:hypothetical protein
MSDKTFITLLWILTALSLVGFIGANLPNFLAIT